jgi:hypothetical protein
VSAVWKVNEPVGKRLRGDFTMLKYLESQSLADLESIVGFDSGRLTDSKRGGCAIIVLAPDEKIDVGDFELGASNRWSRTNKTEDVPWAPHFMTEPDGRMATNSIEGALALRGQDRMELRARVIKFFGMGPGNRPAKVIPNWEHEEGMAYPDATIPGTNIRRGIPQFKMTTPKNAVVFKVLSV